MILWVRWLFLDNDKRTYVLHRFNLSRKGCLLISLRVLYFLQSWLFDRPFLLPGLVCFGEEYGCRSFVILHLDKCRDQGLEPLSLIRCCPAPFTHWVLWDVICFLCLQRVGQSGLRLFFFLKKNSMTIRSTIQFMNRTRKLCLQSLNPKSPHAD